METDRQDEPCKLFCSLSLSCFQSLFNHHPFNTITLIVTIEARKFKPQMSQLEILGGTNQLSYKTFVFNFINMGMFFVFNFCQFTVLTSFLCFWNKDKLIKLGVFLKVKKTIANFLNPLNI